MNFRKKQINNKISEKGDTNVSGSSLFSGKFLCRNQIEMLGALKLAFPENDSYQKLGIYKIPWIFEILA